MKLVEKLIARSQDNRYQPPVTLAFIGDSVTQGCFEVTHIKKEGAYPIKDVHDQDAVYHQVLRQMLADLYPSVPINVINAGVSGGHAYLGLDRLERDVISHRPDLAVVCFGLNDSMGKEKTFERYQRSMDEIFRRLTEAGIETIFMTPNMMCTEVSDSILVPEIAAIAANCASVQNEGWLERFLEEGKTIAAKYGVQVCDCYAKWKKLHQDGVDITEMLANLINHPTRPMHRLFAVSLLETILFE